MQVYTSYFAKMRCLPKDIVPICISRSMPIAYKGLQYSKLAPTYTILNNWQTYRNEEEYRKAFKLQILDRLSQTEVLKDLEELSGGKDVCLVCYEKAGDFCHRHLVSEWLAKYCSGCVEYRYDDDQAFSFF